MTEPPDPEDAPVRSEPASASAAVRRARRASHGDPAGAPGLAGAVLAGDDYHHPDPAEDAPETGVLMLKPGVVLTAAALGELAERVAECGHRITRARIVDPDEIRRRGLLRRHYHDHWAMAAEGVLQPSEAATLVRRYEEAGFVQRFGRSPAQVPVVPALVLAERLGIDPGHVGSWAEAAAARHGVDTGALLACNEVGELADVQVLADLGELAGPDGPAVPVPPDGLSPPLFVLNPQLPLLASWWEDGPDPTFVALVRPVSADPLDHAALRRQFLGTGSPSAWPPGSLRGDLLAGVSALHYRAGIVAGAARNGVHLSNGAVEAMREAVVWFDLDPATTALGSALRAVGCDPQQVLDAVLVEDAPTGDRGLALRPVAEVTAHLGAVEAAARLRGRRLFGADGRPCEGAAG